MPTEANENNRHPPSSFNAEYPYNQSIVSRSGHEIHFNDTPGSESIKIQHTKGTYIEIDSNGNVVQAVEGKHYQYMKDSHIVTVDGHSDTLIRGNELKNVMGDSAHNVARDYSLNIGGTSVSMADGASMNLCNDDRFVSTGGDQTESIDGDRGISVKGDNVERTGGTKTEIVGGDYSVTSSGNFEFISDGLIRFKCRNFVVEAESISIITPQGTITIDGAIGINSGGRISLSGSEIHLNDIVS